MSNWPESEKKIRIKNKRLKNKAIYMPNQWLSKKIEKIEKKGNKKPENVVKKRKKNGKKRENEGQYKHFYFQWLLSLGLKQVFCCIVL